MNGRGMRQGQDVGLATYMNFNTLLGYGLHDPRPHVTTGNHQQSQALAANLLVSAGVDNRRLHCRLVWLATLPASLSVWSEPLL